MKLAVGDSIAGPSPKQLDLTLQGIIQSTLREHIAEYTTAQGENKLALKEMIKATKQQLRNSMGDAALKGIVEWRIDFADVMFQGGFDVIVANPPYVVVKKQEEKDLYRNIYKEGIFGRINLYGLFIQRSLQLLKDGGQLQFINPRTLLTDRYFSNLRKVVRQQSELKSVVLIADRHNTFERVLQECIILHLSKTSKQCKPYEVKILGISVPEDLNTNERTVSINSQRVLLGEEHDWAFLIGESEFVYQIFEKMNSNGAKLPSFGLKAETGKVQFDKYKNYAQPTMSDDGCRLIWAENIQRYSIRGSSKRADKEWLAKGITEQLPPNINGSGIVTQRVTANEQPRRIIATIIRPDEIGAINVYSENHTNFIPLPEGFNALFLLAALNSSALEFVFRRLNSNTQVSAGELNALPFPLSPDQVALEEINLLVSELLDLGGIDTSPENIQEAMAKERRIDNLIGSLYGLTVEDVEGIQQRLPPCEQVYGVS